MYQTFYMAGFEYQMIKCKGEIKSGVTILQMFSPSFMSSGCLREQLVRGKDLPHIQIDKCKFDGGRRIAHI